MDNGSGPTELISLRVAGRCACELHLSGRLYGVVMGQPWQVRGDPALDDEILIEAIGERVVLTRRAASS